MKGEVFGVLLLLLLGGSVAPAMAQQSPVPAVAQDAPLAEETADAPKTADAAKKEEKVCKVIEVTGSRFKSRQCHTQHEWDAIYRATKDKMREIDSQPIRQTGG